ncbi:hypothetical protein ES703_03346 [subsurface metagenome]
MKYKRSLLIVVRLIVGIGLLLFLFSKADTSKVLAILKQTDFLFIVLSIIFFLLAVAIISARWKILLSAHSIDIPFHKTFSYYLVGFFFNNFLPTGVGLDIVRGVYASNNYGKKAECFASVISERMIGFFSILLLGIFSLPLFIVKNRFILFIFLGLVFLTILFIAGIFFFLKGKTLKRFNWLFKIKILSKLKNKIKRLYDALYYYKKRKLVVFQTILLSFLFQVILITMAFFIGKALLVEIPYYYYLAFIPVINIASMIPITINGIGIREGLYVFLFNLASVKSSQSILISIIYLGITMVVSLSGAVIFIFGERKTDRMV